MKFGGAALATPGQFEQIAQIILGKQKQYSRLIVVVSAMGDTTDELIALAKKVNPDPPRREMDMLLSVGERISMSLLAMALHQHSCDVISFTGSQSGIITTEEHSEAKIIEVRPRRIEAALDQKKLVVVAGFQGVSRSGEITTLGRGGSDTSAVALGMALGADHVEFYKDVNGVFNKDPHQHTDARRFEQLSFAQAEDIMKQGSQVLQARCVSLAAKNKLALWVLPFKDPFNDKAGTWIGKGESEKPSVKESSSLHFEVE